MKTQILAALLSFNLLVFTGCLTLNVNMNFPESAVQQATDNYVHDLYKQKERGKAKPAEGETQPSEGNAPEKKTGQQSSWLSPLLESFTLRSVHADEMPRFQINSPKAMEIREKLASNVKEVIAQKRTGILGESKDGKLVIKNPESLKALLQKKIEKLVSDENKYREDLYEEVVTSNHINKSLIGNVRKSFAHSFQSESPSGTWIQEESGEWSQKD